ncbi:MAG TPA: LysR family transcriptional regulator [Burkholderiaceae bacterium]|nr:LysR family transcriptional regulator [Burkholderiaceae bacterium]
MDQIDAMRVYVRVAELASFTQAAQQMGLPKASISTAVQRLEAMLGTRLLHRTTRRVEMTQDGRLFYERCKDLLADLEELQTWFQPGDAPLRGRIRVDMPVGVARDLVIPRLPQFLAAHPALQVELSSTDRRVDLVREGFDCVLRVGALSDSSLVARPLGRYALINCVSPAYVQAHGTPERLEDLARHKLVHYLPSLSGRSPGFEYQDAEGRTQYVPMSGALTVGSSESYLSACLAGLGIVQIPEAPARALLREGRLVEVLPQWRPAPMPVTLLYAHRRHLPRRVQVFMQWMTQVLQPYLAS